ncbi:MAG: FixH family protein [Thiobacillaceae bacterium]
MKVVAQHKSPWWREPMVWLIIALPLTAVLASLVSWWIAARGADPLVAEDYYKQGVAIHQTLERESRAAALGLSAQLRVEDGELRIRLTGRLNAYPDQLELTLVHPSRQEQDLILILPATAQGEYRIALPPMLAGQRRVILQSEQQDWRLTGRTVVPMTSLRLDAPALPQP